MKIGLVIAGGGVSGAAGIGVIEALQEMNIEISHIAGASSGAMVAALYAYGWSTDTIRKRMPMLTKRCLDPDWTGVLKRLVFRKHRVDGWYRGQKLQDILEKWTHHEPLASWKIPCVNVATNLPLGRPVLFSQLPIDGFDCISDASIATAVMASCAIPIAFQPVRIQDRILVDGGVSLNCPVAPLRVLGAERILVVDTVTAFANDSAGTYRSALSIFIHTVNVSLRNQAEPQHALADLVFSPHVGAVGALDLHKIGQCADLGYQYTMQHREELLALF